MMCFSVVFIIAVTVMYILLHRKKILRFQAVAGILMIIYLGVIFASTVFTRMPESERLDQLNFFWSWREVFFHGNKKLLEENLLNLLLLFPVGSFLPPLFCKKFSLWSGFLAGTVVSAGIELCQLVFYRGLFEWDNMVHNGIGCMVGCMISGTVLEYRKKRKNF